MTNTDAKGIIVHYKKKELSEFVTRKTMQFFKRFQIPTNFLKKDPPVWFVDKDFQKGKEIVAEIKVINDTAERGLQIMDQFNQAGLTMDENEAQYILHVVEFCRKKP